MRSRQGKGRGSGRSRNLDSTWTHDKFDEINVCLYRYARHVCSRDTDAALQSPATRGRGGRVRGGGRSGATGGGVADGGGKIELENLSYEVTEADLKVSIVLRGALQCLTVGARDVGVVRRFWRNQIIQNSF